MVVPKRFTIENPSDIDIDQDSVCIIPLLIMIFVTFLFHPHFHKSLLIKVLLIRPSLMVVRKMVQVTVINAASDIYCFNHLDDGSKGATDMILIPEI